MQFSSINDPFHVKPLLFESKRFFLHTFLKIAYFPIVLQIKSNFQSEKFYHVITNLIYVKEGISVGVTSKIYFTLAVLLFVYYHFAGFRVKLIDLEIHLISPHQH